MVAVKSFVITVVLLFAVPALARWDTPRSVVHSTAFTMEEGEFSIGVFSPIVYGANDTITISVHPILWLLLTPNGAVRWKAYEDSLLAVSLDLEGAREFGLEGAAPGHDPRPAGNFSGGTSVTFDLGNGLLVTGQTGYRHHISPDEDHVTFGGAIAYVASSKHLILAQAGAMFSFNRKAVVNPTATLLYAHAWENMRAGVGLAYGNFPIVVDDNGDIDILEASVWPVLDLWWRY
jgi:hypothetical protein